MTKEGDVASMAVGALTTRQRASIRHLMRRFTSTNVQGSTSSSISTRRGRALVSRLGRGGSNPSGLALRHGAHDALGVPNANKGDGSMRVRIHGGHAFIGHSPRRTRHLTTRRRTRHRTRRRTHHRTRRSTGHRTRRGTRHRTTRRTGHRTTRRTGHRTTRGSGIDGRRSSVAGGTRTRGTHHRRRTTRLGHGTRRRTHHGLRRRTHHITRRTHHVTRRGG